MPADPNKVRSLVEENSGDISAIIAIHNETSAGIVNPIEEIGRIAASKNIPFIVDAVSSFGAMRNSFFEMECFHVIGYPSKGLSGVPGATPMAIPREVSDKIHSGGRGVGMATAAGEDS